MATPMWQVQVGCTGNNILVNSPFGAIPISQRHSTDGTCWDFSYFASPDPFPSPTFGAQATTLGSFATVPIGLPLNLLQAALLRDSGFYWNWHTIFCDDEPLNQMQLTLGTPLARFYDVIPELSSPLGPSINAWHTVEFWVKFKIGVNPIGTSIVDIHTAISDNSSNSEIYPLNYLPLAVAGEWNVAYFAKTFTPEEDESWVNRNLRANIFFIGPSVGPTSQSVIEVEWITIRLSDFYVITP